MSDWKAGASKRRDERQAKPVEERAASVRRRDRRRWCRGKMGVEHKPACMPAKTMAFAGSTLFAGWRELVCTVCGKRLATYMPPYDGREHVKPPWVDR